MKTAYGILLFVLILTSGIATGQEANNSVLDQKITLEIHQETIAKVLNQISALTHVFFSYDASLFNEEKKIDLEVSNETLRAALDELFESKFAYNILQEQIIITKASPVEMNPIETEKPNFIQYKGRIIDAKEQTALPYSSIAVLRRNLGTISNIDGDFDLKIPESMRQDSIVISSLGYRQVKIAIENISCDSCIVQLQPVSIQLKEIKVTVINADEIINKVISRIPINYPDEPEIMTAFYREILKQDNNYIDVAEALLEIRKADYKSSNTEDKIKLIKGRKNLNVKPFQMVDFKIQGGPYYATKLDVVKTLETFLDPVSRDGYKYYLDEIIELNNRETYVIQFKPKEKVDKFSYLGKLYIDMSTLALVSADFSLSRLGIKYAHQLMIKKKPKGFYVRPVKADYSVNYRRVENKWHLNNAQTSVFFKVKSKNEKVNSTFYSASELLVTDFKPQDGERYKNNELLNSKDIFTEMITTYDEHFWDDFNIIMPSEELRKSLQNYYLKNDSLFRNDQKTENPPNNF